MTLTELLLTTAVSIGLGIMLIVFISLRLIRARQLGISDLLAMLCLPVVLGWIGLMMFQYDAPGLYTRTVGVATNAHVEKLTYLTGFLGRTDRVRVDTDRGVYMLSSNAEVPRSGDISIVKRERAWGHAKRIFVCRGSTQTTCWAEQEQSE